MFEEMIQRVKQAETISYTGKIENIVGMSIEASGGRAAVGDICRIYNGESGGQVMAEVVGFKNDHILLMPYSDMSGISAGNFVRNTGRRLSLNMGPSSKGESSTPWASPSTGKAPSKAAPPSVWTAAPISTPWPARPSGSGWSSASRPSTACSPWARDRESASSPAPAWARVP